jgi:hypothetical protein
LILTNVCPALTFVLSARILWSHNPSFVLKSALFSATTFRWRSQTGLCHFRRLAYFTAIAGVSSIASFFSITEDNVAIAIAMNGINIFHEYDLIYLFFLPHRNIVLLAPL